MGHNTEDREVRRMTSLIFLLTGIAMMTAAGGRRDVAIGLFAVCLIVSVVWLNHHMTDPLTLSL
jgi:hypothetical protein